MSQAVFHYDILDKQRRLLLPLFKKIKPDFYLAGGTGLALQLGHRDSIDFDFFCQENFDTVRLYRTIQEIFVGFKIKKIQEEKNTLTIILDDKVKLSFFSYPYKLIKPLLSDKYLNVATVPDIAVMKFSAIVSRATNKDYIDLYFILQDYSLEQLLNFSKKKMPDLDINLILKSLIYFKDVTKERIRFRTTPVSWQQVEDFIKQIVVKQKF